MCWLEENNNNKKKVIVFGLPTARTMLTNLYKFTPASCELGFKAPQTLTCNSPQIPCKQHKDISTRATPLPVHLFLILVEMCVNNMKNTSNQPVKSNAFNVTWSRHRHYHHIYSIPICTSSGTGISTTHEYSQYKQQKSFCSHRPRS